MENELTLEGFKIAIKVASIRLVLTYGNELKEFQGLARVHAARTVQGILSRPGALQWAHLLTHYQYEMQPVQLFRHWTNKVLSEAGDNLQRTASMTKPLDSRGTAA